MVVFAVSVSLDSIKVFPWSLNNELWFNYQLWVTTGIQEGLSELNKFIYLVMRNLLPSGNWLGVPLHYSPIWKIDIELNCIYIIVYCNKILQKKKNQHFFYKPITWNFFSRKYLITTFPMISRTFLSYYCN